MTDAQWPDRSWLKVSELAAIAGVNEKTVRREARRGHLTAERHGAGWGALIIDRAEAERWLAEYSART